MTVFLGAMIVGLTLGLLGSGGSILTVPILTYVLGHDQKIAVAESMAIVSGLAFLGVLAAARRGQIDLRSALFLVSPGSPEQPWVRSSPGIFPAAPSSPCLQLSCWRLQA